MITVCHHQGVYPCVLCCVPVCVVLCTCRCVAALKPGQIIQVGLGHIFSGLDHVRNEIVSLTMWKLINVSHVALL